ncbi:MAG: hypothetical protein Q9227_003345 [Pyrenula ochraceoflavens]
MHDVCQDLLHEYILGPFEDYGFIALLGLVQRLQVDILSITWQTQRGRIGTGGQAGISQALVNAENSFAFKRFKPQEGDWYQSIVQEIVALSQPIVKRHPYVASLEGICFECEVDYSVKPVLVFEKTPLGDLERFMRTERGQFLPINERLKLCAEIGKAVGDMHANNIVHGDLNPGNVLVIGEGQGYHCKIIDFGYSTLFHDDTACISMPHKEGWNAPEHIDRGDEDCRDYSSYEPVSAKQIDVYSYGLLSLWLIAEDKQNLPKPKDHDGNRQQYLTFVKEMKGLDNETRNNFSNFIRLTLAYEPGRRVLDFGKLLSQIGPQRRESPSKTRPYHIGSQQPNYTGRGESATEQLVFPTVEELQLVHMAPQLYAEDFRIRAYIAEDLRAIVSCSHDTIHKHIDRENAISQLAWCYRMGFGLPADRNQALQLANELGSGRVDLIDQPTWLGGKDYPVSIGSGLYQKLNLRGHIWPNDLSKRYRLDGVSDRALEVLRREIQDTKNALGIEHTIVFLLTGKVAGLLRERGQQHEAVEVLSTMLRVQQKALAADDPLIWDTRARLAKVCRDIGQYEEAIRLGTMCCKQHETINPLSIRACDAHDELAATLRSADQYDEAEKLERTALEKKQDLSPTHEQTLKGKNNLALTLQKQSRCKESQELYEETMESMYNTLGKEHINTIRCKENLASVYSDQSTNLKQAAIMLEEVIDVRMKFYPEAHPETLTSLSNLSAIYQRLGDYSRAREKAENALELSRSSLGDQNPRTLAAMNQVATIHQKQGNWTQALPIQRRLMELSPSVSPRDNLHNVNNLALTLSNLEKQEEVEQMIKAALAAADRLDQDDPLILASKNTLAIAYQAQGRLREVLNLHAEVVDGAHRKLGLRHQDTLIYQQNLAGDMERVGNLDGAISLLHATYITQCDTPDIGPNHEDTLLSQRVLAKWRGHD